jgi:hypothetical protein
MDTKTTISCAVITVAALYFSYCLWSNHHVAESKQTEEDQNDRSPKLSLPKTASPKTVSPQKTASPRNQLEQNSPPWSKIGEQSPSRPPRPPRPSHLAQVHTSPNLGPLLPPRSPNLGALDNSPLLPPMSPLPSPQESPLLPPLHRGSFGREKVAGATATATTSGSPGSTPRTSIR